MQLYEVKKEISRIDIFESDSELFGCYLTGLIMYNHNDECVLECGKFHDPHRSIKLDIDEKVIGIKCRVFENCPTTVLDIKF